jgi:hypothetical protein
MDHQHRRNQPDKASEGLALCAFSGGFIYLTPSPHFGADTIGVRGIDQMVIDVDGELQKAAENMEVAMNSLMKAGFTKEQLEQLERYVHAAIVHSQYAILKADREIRNEAAFQSKVL